MKQFMDLLYEDQFIQYNSLMEDLITFGGVAYPQFGNVVIMAGGAGSGKGFVLSNLVGLQGKVFDVDALKQMAGKATGIRNKVKKELGQDLEAITSNLRDPENVAKVHDIIGNYLQLDKKYNNSFFKSVLQAHPDRKPNMIFDTTLRDLTKLQDLTRQAVSLGYSKDNIHIVWVINDIEVAKSQNAKRSRVVPTEILVNTHKGAQQTMADIVNMGSKLKRYMNGDIVFAFNKVGVDASLSTSSRGGRYIEKANYFYAKKKGKAPLSIDKLDKSIRAKIASYVPKMDTWN